VAILSYHIPFFLFIPQQVWVGSKWFKPPQNDGFRSQKLHEVTHFVDSLVLRCCNYPILLCWVVIAKLDGQDVPGSQTFNHGWFFGVLTSMYTGFVCNITLQVDTKKLSFKVPKKFHYVSLTLYSLYSLYSMHHSKFRNCTILHHQSQTNSQPIGDLHGPARQVARLSRSHLLELWHAAPNLGGWDGEGENTI
jgi:hypothetical protein